MKIIRYILFFFCVLSSLASMGQEEGIAARMGSHKGRNVAFVRDLHMDSNLVINAILIQAYSDEEWSNVLTEFGKNVEDVCGDDAGENTLCWTIAKTALDKKITPGTDNNPCLVFCRCSEKTISLFFPRNKLQHNKLISKCI